MATKNLDEAIQEVLPMFRITELKKEQKDILQCIIEKKDCVAVLPTGFGKSLPFQLSIPVQRLLTDTAAQNDKVIVVCPLISLMQDQVQKLSQVVNLTAAYVGSSLEDDSKIKEGLIDFIYGSPEALVGDSAWRTNIQRLNVSTIVVDEFHTIAAWGEDDDGTQKQAFRKWFASVGELRSLFPSASLLALSATCTMKIKRRVMKVLQLKEDTLEISVSPNRSNIKLTAFKISNTIEMSMCWLVDGLNEKRVHFPRTSLYCVSIRDAAKLYTYIVNELPHCSHLIEMYHSETPESNKEKIISELKQNDSSLKLVISSSALGMGVDIKDCQSVILFGPPNNLVDLLQQIGRVGRDDKYSEALILYNSYHLRQIGSEVKDILKTDHCRRIQMMKCFLNSEGLETLKVKESGLHTCCDLCAAKCSCNDCKILPLEKIYRSSNVDQALHDENSDSEDTESYDLSDYEDQLAMSEVEQL